MDQPRPEVGSVQNKSAPGAQNLLRCADGSLLRTRPLDVHQGRGEAGGGQFGWAVHCGSSSPGRKELVLNALRKLGWSELESDALRSSGRANVVFMAEEGFGGLWAPVLAAKTNRVAKVGWGLGRIILGGKELFL